MNIIEYNSILSSVKFGSDMNYNISYIRDLILFLCNKNTFADFSVRRPIANEGDNELIFQLLKNEQLKNIDYEPDLNISFSINLTGNKYSFANFASKSWFEYESFSILFLGQEYKNSQLLRDYSWELLVDKFKSFVIFKSIEDDVLWLAQSKSLHSTSILRNII